MAWVGLLALNWSSYQPPSVPINKAFLPVRRAILAMCRAVSVLALGANPAACRCAHRGGQLSHWQGHLPAWVGLGIRVRHKVRTAQVFQVFDKLVEIQSDALAGL